jgi:hypothetical protein
MNGIALLLLTATLGVEYDWRTTEDGQIEYVLIVEPDFIPSLAEGSEIRSSVPPELESVQRLCIRIAQPANSAAAPRTETPRSLPANAFRSRIGLRANTEPTTIVWKAKGQPEESANVRYGWQPTKDGLQEYFVQIDPKFLRTLAPGDEIYTTLSAEAGRVDTFVVFSNSKQLPKVPGRSAAGPLAGGAPAATFPGANPPSPTGTFGPPNPLGAAPLASAPLPNTNNPPGFGPLNTAPPLSPAPPLDRPAPFGSPAFGGLNDNGSRVNPAGGYDQSPPAPTYGNNFAPSNTRPNLNAPNPAPLPNNNGFANEDFRPNDAFRGNDLRTNDPRNQATQPDSYRAPPLDPRTDLYPPASGGFASNNPNAPGVRNTNAPLQPPSANSPGSAPYRPSVGYPQDNAPLPPAYDNRQPPNGQTAVGYNPNVADNQMASLGNNTVRPGVRSDLPLANSTAANPAEKPWWPLVFMSFFLFISIGANVYLGWTVAEFYSRYKLAVERLRSSSRA